MPDLDERLALIENMQQTLGDIEQVLDSLDLMLSGAKKTLDLLNAAVAPHLSGGTA